MIRVESRKGAKPPPQYNDKNACTSTESKTFYPHEDAERM